MSDPPPRRPVWDSSSPEPRKRPASSRSVPPTGNEPPRRVSSGVPPARDLAPVPAVNRSVGGGHGGGLAKVLLLFVCLGLVTVAVMVLRGGPEYQDSPPTTIELSDGPDGGTDVPTSSDVPQPGEQSSCGVSESKVVGAGALSAEEMAGSVSEVARLRLIDDLEVGASGVQVYFAVDPGSPSNAELSVSASVDAVLAQLSCYFDDVEELVVIALFTQGWGVNAVPDFFDNANGFVSRTQESIVEYGMGVSQGDCSVGEGPVGFATRDELDRALIVVDVGRSCAWNPTDGWKPDFPEVTVPHEVMHIAQQSLLRQCPVALPTWFAEGQAEFVGWNLVHGDVGSNREPTPGVSMFEAARQFRIDSQELGGYSSLSELNEYTENGAEYLVGALAIELLVARFGWDSTVELLVRMNGQFSDERFDLFEVCEQDASEFSTFDVVFQDIFGMSVADFSDEAFEYAELVVSGIEPDIDRPIYLPLLGGRIRLEPESMGASYDRKSFGYPADLDGDGCDTRDEVLIVDSRVNVVMDSSVCGVAVGEWYSPYDGVLTDDPGGIQIDHVVALSEAWASGASGWSSVDAVEFANAVGGSDNLQVASSSSNQSKSDKDPAEWLPGNDSAVCWYVTEWSRLKLEWDLSMDELEYEAVAEVLESCSVSSSSMPVNVVERLFVASNTTVVVAADTDAGASAGSDSSSSGGSSSAAYYQNCSAARAAGAAPILFGEPGYRPALDRDGDGVACE